MARLYDSSGNLLGGLAPHETHPPSFALVSPEAQTRRLLNDLGDRRVPDLLCSYRLSCASSIEDGDERHHCDLCGRDYCTTHAEPAAHDCIGLA